MPILLLFLATSQQSMRHSSHGDWCGAQEEKFDTFFLLTDIGKDIDRVVFNRSEERRVGKECHL